MTTVLCIYSPGGDFYPLHVARLVDQVRRQAPGTPVICLTDAASEVSGIVDATLHLMGEERSWGWRGCWPKIALFRFLGPVLYLDLDINIVERLDPLLEAAEQHQLIMCRDFWSCSPPLANSSIMAWNGSLMPLYREFAADPDAGKRCDGTVKDRHWCEQVWLLRRARAAGIKVQWWQDLLPGAVRSYKNEVKLGLSTENMVVCASHGPPRPWEPGGADGIGGQAT